MNPLRLLGGALVLGSLGEFCYHEYLKTRAIQAIKVNKLAFKEPCYSGVVDGYETKHKFFAPYGVVKDGKFTSLPGSCIGWIDSELYKKNYEPFWNKVIRLHIDDDAIQPVVSFLQWSLIRKQFYFWRKEPVFEDIYNAAKVWAIEEIKEGQLGHVDDLNDVDEYCEADREKIMYYSDIVILAIGLSLDIPNIYSKGFDAIRGYFARVLYHPRRYERICQVHITIKSSSDSFYQIEPKKGHISKKILKLIKTEEKYSSRVENPLLTGNVISVYGRTTAELDFDKIINPFLTDEYQLQEWERLRIQVFRIVNKRLTEILNTKRDTEYRFQVWERLSTQMFGKKKRTKILITRG